MSTHEQDSDSEPSWKKLKLSFERPYKDDSGNRIPILFDLTSEGERIYEPKETSAARLETNLRRIFQERGVDFFDQRDGLTEEKSSQTPVDEEVGEEKESGFPSSIAKPMTVEELYSMRSEIIPQLFVALGEMSHARDLLNAVLSGTSNIQAPSDPSPSSLSATIVSKPPPIISVQAFNSQLIIGNKDEALRKAAGLFKSAAESMERSRLRGEKYWVDALRIRRANWGLTPAPLPAGSAVGKGADKTSKDFVISYGLEGSSTTFRRRAVAQLPTLGNPDQHLILPYHQNTRLRISVTATGESSWGGSSCFVSPRPEGTVTDPENVLKMAQTEIIDQEIFSFLVKESGNLPTASARVSERLIAIDAAQGLDLTFELVDTTANTQASPKGDQNLCELIYHVLRAFLLRRHAGVNLSSPNKMVDPSKLFEGPSLLLQPIIDVLQYRVFCERVEVELRNGVEALNAIGIPSTLLFTSVRHPGEYLVSLLSKQGKKEIGGEAVIRMDNWHTIWFTFASPSTLTAHLSQATLTLASLPQLSQLLMDEIERCMLKKICGIGLELSRARGGNWFIDLNRCVGKWEGCVLNFQISYGSNMDIGCSAFKLDGSTNERGDVQHYANSKLPLLSWVHQLIQASLNPS